MTSQCGGSPLAPEEALLFIRVTVQLVCHLVLLTTGLDWANWLAVKKGPNRAAGAGAGAGTALQGAGCILSTKTWKPSGSRSRHRSCAQIRGHRLQR